MSASRESREAPMSASRESGEAQLSASRESGEAQLSASRESREAQLSAPRESEQAPMSDMREMAPELEPRIALLPEEVRNQIAAGEVIERPASLVKELVENALDAGARSIRVELELGGQKLVRVTDDGCGMGPRDLELAFAAHATSKLRALDDLQHIASLGFRGEALASIGSVARCTLRSRPRNAGPFGWEIRVEGGQVRAPREVGCDYGTSIEVRDLFFNTPARRAFLKTSGTELARCMDVLQRAAIAHPGVAFSALHEGRRLFDVEAGMDLAARIRRTFGSELADALLPVHAREDGMALDGYVAPPRFARVDSARQMWFLNGRALKDKLFSRLLREAFRGFQVEQRQPVAFLMLALDPARIDVNVHPTKAEVRLRDERRVFGFALNALRAALARGDLSLPGSKMLSGNSSAMPTTSGFAQPAAAQAVFPESGTLVPQGRQREAEWPRAEEAGALDVREAAPAALAANAPSTALEARLAGGGEPGAFLQIARTYLVRALPDGFEIIDQHALHERVTYEGLKRELARGALELQRLLVPELVEVSRAELELLRPHFESLARVGIELQAFGEALVAVHGLPALLQRPRPELIVRDLVALLEEAGRTPRTEELLEASLQRAACRSSVMAGDALSESEARALLARGAELENDQTCVHGRPTRVRFTLAELERAFQRR